MAEIVTVMGGTGFLGRRVVLHLRQHGFTVRIASRHAARSREVFGSDDPGLDSVEADIHDERSVAGAVAGAHGVVNAVSLYVEHGRETFQSVHVDGAGRLARCAVQAGVRRLIHVSGIGADSRSPSPYIRYRAEGEQAVRAAFPKATIVRPAVMFGPDDGFLSTIIGLLRRLPVLPMFGQGCTRLQPAHVDDVAEAIVRSLERDDLEGATIECGGPRVYTYEELLRTVARRIGVKPRLVAMPFAAWHALARLAELLPRPPVNRNQVELMQLDNVASAKVPGFRDLGIVPQPIEQVLPPVAQCAAGKAA